MCKNLFRTAFLVFALIGCLALPAMAADEHGHEGGVTDPCVGTIDKAALEKVLPTKPPYSPYAGRNFPTRPLFGDTHLHTSFSMDAGAAGARLTPSDAYRFARGEEITASSKQPVKLSRPLDFLVVADHSDGMGFFPQLMTGDPVVLATEQGRKWYDLINGGKGAEAAFDIIQSFSAGKMPKGFPTPGTKAFRSAWQEEIKAAEAYNDPGRFTAFIGYEWTVNTGGNNFHRNVIFRGGGAQASLVEPFTTLPPLGNDNPESLWKWMAAAEEKTGSEVLAIAHNGNLSNGNMFPMVEAFGKKLDKSYVETRARWERLYEVTQMKGDGETHPLPLAERRVRRFRALGQGQPRRHPGQDEGHAPVRVRPRGAQERPRARGEAGHEPLQVRHDRQHRRAHRPRRGRGGELLRQ